MANLSPHPVIEDPARIMRRCQAEKCGHGYFQNPDMAYPLHSLKRLNAGLKERECCQTLRGTTHGPQCARAQAWQVCAGVPC